MKITRTEFYESVEQALSHIAEMEASNWAVRQIVPTTLGLIVVFEREQ